MSELVSSTTIHRVGPLSILEVTEYQSVNLMVRTRISHRKVWRGWYSTGCLLRSSRDSEEERTVPESPRNCLKCLRSYPNIKRLIGQPQQFGSKSFCQT